MTDDPLLALAERLEAYDPTTSPDNRADELAMHQDIVMAAGLGSLSCAFEATFVRSLDAAMVLVPEGYDPQICKGPMFCLSANETRPWRVSLIGNAREVEEEFGPEMAYDSHDANAATAALALSAAALRARASTEKQ